MSVAANLRAVRERITTACDATDRDPSEVVLVAVSKTVGADAIREAYDAGQRHFGESRLQEALPKIEALPQDIVWHFVGKLQSNKALRASESFHVIHTLESESQLKAFARAERPVDALIEVNIAQEPQKSGIDPENLAELNKLVLQWRTVRLRGLMTVGPANLPAEALRPFFRTMRLLQKQTGLEWLSMGMSGDLEVAIQEGSTHVRVGTAIFGERN